MNQDTISTGYDAGETPLKPLLPTSLNVLTILTFIGSAIGLLFSFWGFIGAKSNYDERDKVLEKMNSGQMPKWVKSLTGDPDQFLQMVTKSYENRLPILLLSLAALLLCIVGAMQMRRLKKQGYILYVVGQVLPFITQALFIAAFAITGLMSIILGAIALLFIIMYTTQRKYLVY